MRAQPKWVEIVSAPSTRAPPAQLQILWRHEPNNLEQGRGEGWGFSFWPPTSSRSLTPYGWRRSELAGKQFDDKGALLSFRCLFLIPYVNDHNSKNNTTSGQPFCFGTKLVRSGKF